MYIKYYTNTKVFKFDVEVLSFVKLIRFLLCTSTICFFVWFKLVVPFRTGKHTIFGRVCHGMEIIKRLGSIQTDNSDRYASSLKDPFVLSGRGSHYLTAFYLPFYVTCIWIRLLSSLLTANMVQDQCKCSYKIEIEQHITVSVYPICINIRSTEVNFVLAILTQYASLSPLLYLLRGQSSDIMMHDTST